MPPKERFNQKKTQKKVHAELKAKYSSPLTLKKVATGIAEHVANPIFQPGTLKPTEEYKSRSLGSKILGFLPQLYTRTIAVAPFLGKEIYKAGKTAYNTRTSLSPTNETRQRASNLDRYGITYMDQFTANANKLDLEEEKYFQRLQGLEKNERDYYSNNKTMKNKNTLKLIEELRKANLKKMSNVQARRRDLEYTMERGKNTSAIPNDSIVNTGINLGRVTSATPIKESTLTEKLSAIKIRRNTNSINP